MGRISKKINVFFPKKQAKLLISVGIFIIAAVALWFFVVGSYKSETINIVPQEKVDRTGAYAKEFSVPEQVKAIYITSPSVFNKRFDELVSLIDETELNSVVITMKSGGGLYKGGGVDELVRKLKEKGVYTIARLTIFQDNALARSRTGLALRDSSGGLWRDGSGAYWVDPASQEVWDYNIGIAKEMIDLGFDELNFDYIRFPSDGILSSIRYPAWSVRESKADVIKEFFAYFTKKLKDYEPKAMLSADIFAYVLLTHIDDAGIGQRLEDAVSYFDAVAPMIYPSHYSAGNFGFQNPAAYPYDVTLISLNQAKSKLAKFEDAKGILRPWLQAFHVGAIYDVRAVNLEKQAVLDAGFNNGWMLWNPQNRYPSELFDISPE